MSAGPATRATPTSASTLNVDKLISEVKRGERSEEQLVAFFETEGKGILDVVASISRENIRDRETLEAIGNMNRMNVLLSTIFATAREALHLEEGITSEIRNGLDFVNAQIDLKVEELRELGVKGNKVEVKAIESELIRGFLGGDDGAIPRMHESHVRHHREKKTEMYAAPLDLFRNKFEAARPAMLAMLEGVGRSEIEARDAQRAVVGEATPPSGTTTEEYATEETRVEESLEPLEEKGTEGGPSALVLEVGKEIGIGEEAQMPDAMELQRQAEESARITAGILGLEISAVEGAGETQTQRPAERQRAQLSDSGAPRQRGKRWVAEKRQGLQSVASRTGSKRIGEGRKSHAARKQKLRDSEKKEKKKEKEGRHGNAKIAEAAKTALRDGKETGTSVRRPTPKKTPQAQRAMKEKKKQANTIKSVLRGRKKPRKEAKEKKQTRARKR